MDRIVSEPARTELLTLRSDAKVSLALFGRAFARLSFAATVILIPFRMRQLVAPRSMPPIFRDYTDLLLFASDLFLLATLVLWITSLLLQPRRVRTGPKFLSMPIAGLTVLATLSTLSSVDPTISLYHVIRLVLLALFSLYILNEVTLDQLVVPVAIQVLIQSLVGIAQVWQQHSLGLGAVQELELDPSWSGVSVVLADGIRSLRAYGLTDHPNILGGCLAFGLLLVAAWYAGSKTRWHAVVTAVLAVGAVGLFVTFSRAAWIALAAGLLFSLAVFFRTRQQEPVSRWLNLVCALFIVLLPFFWHAWPYLGARLNVHDAFQKVTLENRSISERDNLMAAALQIGSEHPLSGIGVGALPEAERIRYPDVNDFGADYQPAHIVLLDAAVETGVVGGALYLLAILSPWLAMWWNRKRLTWTPALIGVSGVLLAVTVVGFFDYYTWLLAPGQLWQWLVWGAWGSLYSSSFTAAPSEIGARHA